MESLKFKDKYSFEKRKEESSRIKKRYPDRIPVIVEKNPDHEISKIYLGFAKKIKSLIFKIKSHH